MVDPAKLKPLSQGTLTSSASGRQLACCPTINLAATIGDEEVLHVWRSNGELVSKHTERNQKIQALRWKEDGNFLAVGWSDGVVRLMGLENSKAVHQINIGTGGQAKITFIAWSMNYTGKKPRRRGAKDAPKPGNALLSSEIDTGKKHGILDLPHELMFLDVETALPKISPLPVSGGSGDDMFVFSTRSSLEFVFRPFAAEDTNTVNIMLVGADDGRLHLSIYDSFVVGTFQYALPKGFSSPGGLRLCYHAGHPEVSTHSLLFKSSGSDQNSIYLVPMDLIFVYSSPVNLCLLASKTTALQNLLRYVKQTQLHMAGEWKSTRELPDRFLSSLSEELGKMPGGTVTVGYALYHTVVTGHVFPCVKEWLVDTLAERGHKRWDKAVVSGLENLRSLVHENMIPALERCGLILSRLLGLARFHDPLGSIGFSVAQIMKLMEIISCLTMVAHRILLMVMEELEIFTAFSTWLRFEIDRLASSSMSDELMEKEATMDHSKILEYIQHHLVTNPLSIHFDEVSKDDYKKDWEHAEDGPSLLEMLDKQFKRAKKGQPYMKALPQLEFLVNYLNSRANIVFADIAEAEKRGVRFGQPTRLDVGASVSKHDMYMGYTYQGDHPHAITFTALASDKLESELYVFRSEMQIINAISGSALTSVCGLVLGDGKILDFKFLGDKALLVLWVQKDSPAVLLSIPFQSKRMAYKEYKDGVAMQTQKLTTEDVVNAFSPINITAAADFVPAQMEIIPRNNSRGGMPARVWLLARDRKTYQVFEIPEDVGKEEPQVSQEDVSMG